MDGTCILTAAGGVLVGAVLAVQIPVAGPAPGDAVPVATLEVGRLTGVVDGCRQREENSQRPPLAPPQPPGAAEEGLLGLSEWWAQPPAGRHLRRWDHHVTQAEGPAKSCASTTRGSAIPLRQLERAWGLRHMPTGTGGHGLAPGCPGPEPALPLVFATFSRNPRSCRPQRRRLRGRCRSLAPASPRLGPCHPLSCHRRTWMLGKAMTLDSK